MARDNEHSKDDDKLPSTRTKRDLVHRRFTNRYYRAKPKPKSMAKVKAKSLKKVAKREETGKEILERIMREIYASIRRKEEKN